METLTGTVSFKSVSQIFDTDDPSPEGARDLSGRAEDRIFHAAVTSARGFSSGLCTDLEIKVPARELTTGRSEAIASAIRAHFLSRAGELLDEMIVVRKAGFREIRLTLAVCIPSFFGIGILAKYQGDPVARILETVLIIFCWVVIWQPFQSLVFDRWTAKETARIYKTIADIPIRIIPAG